MIGSRLEMSIKLTCASIELEDRVIDIATEMVDAVGSEYRPRDGRSRGHQRCRLPMAGSAMIGS